MRIARPYGRYEVHGVYAYRGHKPGEQFISKLDFQAEQWATNLGIIRLIEYVDVSIKPKYLTFPQGHSNGKE